MKASWILLFVALCNLLFLTASVIFGNFELASILWILGIFFVCRAVLFRVENK